MSDETSLIVSQQRELSVEDAVAHVKKIQELMEKVLVKDVHYGTVPGTKKPSLYKAGAEKLCLVFRLVPKYDVIRRELGGEHIEYEMICSLYHLGSGALIGQGVGSANTMEPNYRYRGSGESTGKPVPGNYWNLKKANKKEEAEQLLGGPEFKAEKFDGRWMIVTASGERKSNPDIPGCYNTIYKMSKKRAHIDATLTACAASDIFTQDVEDLPGDESGGSGTSKKKQQSKGKKDKAGQKANGQQNGKKDPVRQGIIDEIVKILKEPCFTDKERAAAKEVIQKTGSNEDLEKLQKQVQAEWEKRQNQAEESPVESDLDEAANQGWDEPAAAADQATPTEGPPAPRREIDIDTGEITEPAESGEPELEIF